MKHKCPKSWQRLTAGSPESIQLKKQLEEDKAKRDRYPLKLFHFDIFYGDSEEVVFHDEVMVIAETKDEALTHLREKLEENYGFESLEYGLEQEEILEVPVCVELRRL